MVAKAWSISPAELDLHVPDICTPGKTSQENSVMAIELNWVVSMNCEKNDDLSLVVGMCEKKYTW